jgi:S1-C subfamily serine protease
MLSKAISTVKLALTKPVDVVRTISYSVVLATGLAMGYAFFRGFAPGHDADFVTGYKNMYEMAQRQTVLVETPTGSGSGFVIKRLNDSATRVFVWTAAHVVSDVDVCKIHIIFRTGDHKAGDAWFAARVILRPHNVDAALLLVDADPGFFVESRFEFATPRVGTPVFHVGNLLGKIFDGSVTAGVVSQIGVHPDDPTWPWDVCDQTTTLIIPGSSGGPLFSNMDGKVLGICVGWPQIPGISFYVPTRALVAATKGFSWTLKGDVCPPDDLLNEMIRRAELPKKSVPDILKEIIKSIPAPPAPPSDDDVDCSG